METSAQVINTVDTAYKAGYVECWNCGWHKDLGDGFNQYLIDICPNCTPTLTTREQRKVMTGAKGNYTVELGSFTYFVLSNGLHIQFAKRVVSIHTGLTEQQADRL